LDLGFEVCFYNGMSQVVKTGLQFVFPVYLWLLIFVIVFLSRYWHCFQAKVSNGALPVLATLMLLAYTKILRASIRVYSFVYIKSLHHDKILTWKPNPTINYFTGGHIILFCIASLFLLLFIPTAIGFTIPKILHYKHLNHLFPLFDCFLAPYKHKYRYWFGVRLLILLYLSLMETVLSENKECILLSSITVVGTFTIIQASFFPFKYTATNYLDLILTGIFLLLSSFVLYFQPSSNGYKEVNITVNILGYFAFAVFCVIVVYHVYLNNYCSRCGNVIDKIFKQKTCKNANNDYQRSIVTAAAVSSYGSVNDNDDIPEEAKFQESLFEHLF